MWKLIPHCCFGLHFPSYKGCQAFSYINCTLYIFVCELSVYILCPFFYFVLSQKYLFTVYSFMWDGNKGWGRGFGQHNPLWPELLELCLKPPFHFGCEGMVPSLWEAECFPLKKKKKEKRIKGEKSTSPHHIILFAIHEACCCCTVHVGFVLQQPKSTAQNPPAETLQSGVPMFRNHPLKVVLLYWTMWTPSPSLSGGNRSPKSRSQNDRTRALS